MKQEPILYITINTIPSIYIAHIANIHIFLLLCASFGLALVQFGLVWLFAQSTMYECWMQYQCPMHMSINATDIVLFLLFFSFFFSFFFKLSFQFLTRFFNYYMHHGFMVSWPKEINKNDAKIKSTQNKMNWWFMFLPRILREKYLRFSKPIELWHFTNLLMNQSHNIPIQWF